MARGGPAGGARTEKKVSGGAAEGPVPAVVMGLGFIGQEIARAALQCEELELIGAVDKSPSLVGKKLSEVLGIPAGTFKISGTIAQAVGRRQGVVLLHATGSKLPQVTDQVLEALSLGMHVVSTCEELSFPWFNHAALAEKIDRPPSGRHHGGRHRRQPRLRPGSPGGATRADLRPGAPRHRHPRRRRPDPTGGAAAQGGRAA